MSLLGAQGGRSPAGWVAQTRVRSRCAEELTEAAENVDQWYRYVLSRQFANPVGWELQNMLTVASLVIEAASLRTETRGGHVRTDYLDQDDERWACHITFRNGDTRPKKAEVRS